MKQKLTTKKKNHNIRKWEGRRQHENENVLWKENRKINYKKATSRSLKVKVAKCKMKRKQIMWEKLKLSISNSNISMWDFSIETSVGLCCFQCSSSYVSIRNSSIFICNLTFTLKTWLSADYVLWGLPFFFFRSFDLLMILVNFWLSYLLVC